MSIIYGQLKDKKLNILHPETSTKVILHKDINLEVFLNNLNSSGSSESLPMPPNDNFIYGMLNSNWVKLYPETSLDLVMDGNGVNTDSSLMETLNGS